MNNKELKLYSIDEAFPEHKCQRLIIDILIRGSKLQIIGAVQALDIIKIDKVPGISLDIIEELVNDIGILLNECDLSKTDINIQQIEKILEELGNLRFDNIGIIGKAIINEFYVPAIQCSTFTKIS